MPRACTFLDVDAQTDFPLENLPYGVFTPPSGAAPRVGVAIGDFVLDLAVLAGRGLLALPAADAGVFAQPTLEAFMALGPAAWDRTRGHITYLLRDDVSTLRDDASLRDAALVPRAEVQMHLPCRVGGFTDFYTSLDHATTVSRIFRGADAGAPPQFRHLPIAYNGRASSVVVSGTSIRRPCGQFVPRGAQVPVFAPTAALDFELEVGLLIGTGNPLGTPLPAARAAEHIFGVVLVNDWSARDIQRWEYVPLGPFQGKAFATSISPWVVPLAALEPFRCVGPVQEPAPPSYLRLDAPWALDLELEVALAPAGSANAQTITRTNFAQQYWRLPQLVAQHTSCGCNLQDGDLLASGTVSGATPASRGCLLEMTRDGQTPLTLTDGTQRCYLADGDTVVLRGGANAADVRIGFGECRGTILPAVCA